MEHTPRHPYPRFSARRKALLALVALALGLVTWLHLTGAAGISGMPVSAMDWNGDGTVSQAEFLQAFYSVTVTVSREGPRECRAYRWRNGDRQIRVDCTTDFSTPPAP